MTHLRLIILASLAGLFGLVSPALAVAQGLDNAVRYFDEGNLRYRQGDYRGAVTSYERAIDEGFVSGALFFNMGNAYYRLDERGQAVRYYEKAADIIPGNAALIHNLEIIREQSVDQFSRLPEPLWNSWWRALVRVFGTTGLFATGAAFYITAVAALALRIRGGQTSWRRRVLAMSVALAVLFISAGFRASVQSETATRAVILMDEVTLRDAPDGSRSDLEVHEGLVVDVVVTRNGWMEVRLPNGATGWVRTETVGLI